MSNFAYLSVQLMLTWSDFILYKKSKSETYSCKILTPWLNGLDEETAGCWIPMNSTDKVLYWRLMGQIYQVLNMIHNKPGQVFWIM